MGNYMLNNKYISILLFSIICLLFLTSVSASDIDNTLNNASDMTIGVSEENSNELNINNDVLPIYESDIGDDIHSSNQEDLIVNPDFEDGLNGWDNTGSVSVSDNGKEGKCIILDDGSTVSQNVDWTNIEKISFYYKASDGDLTVDFGTTRKLIACDSNWKLYEFNATSLTGVSTLKFSASDYDDGIYIDSIVYEVKGNDEELIANFISDETNGLNTLTVQFTDASLGSPNSWLWDFGDGTTSTIQNPTHTYTNPGFYNVTLKISKKYKSDKIIKNNYIIVSTDDLKANFTNNNQAYVNSPVEFKDISEGYPAYWYWNFGDGSYSNLQNPTHYYTIAGNYNVTLTISSKYNSINKTNEIKIYNMLNADFTLTSIGGTSFLFNDESSGDNLTYLWDLGDGTTSTNKDPNLGTYGRVAHAYSPGTYVISLTVSDGFTTSTKSEVIVVDYKSSYVEEFDSFENSADGWTFSDGTEIRSDQTETVQFYNDGKYCVFISNTNEYIEKEVNFDNIDYFKFYAIANPSLGGPQSFAIYIDDNQVLGTDADARSWKTISYDTSNLIGTHKVRVQSTGGYNIYIDSFEFGSYNHYLANFTTSITKIEADEITVAFKDASTGTTNSWLWNFGDGTTSTEHNPTHTFTKGNHAVSLSIYRDGIKMASVTNYLTLALPTIASTGEAYATIQDAINAAGEGDVIEIPDIGAAFTENLVINKTLTLNFNGVTLNAKDNNQALLNVTNGANVIVNNINIGKNAILATSTDSTLNITDSEINVNLALNEGNINLLDDSFTNSIITVLANVNINNADISIGAVVVNGGKSRIYNSILTGCDVAITQNAGELDIISNLITDNNIAVNVTGGTKTNIEYNLIYSNDEFGLVYVGDNVTMDNNWWGSDEPSRANGETLSAIYKDVFRFDEYFVDEFSYLTLKFTTSESVMGTNKDYSVNIEMVTDNGGKVNGYLKTIDLEITSSEDSYYPTLEDGNGQFTITTPNTEANGITLTVLGNNYVLNTPVVAKTNVLITVVGEAVVDGSVVVNVEVPYATGDVTFYIDGDAQTRTLTNNQASYTISKLTAGKHNIIAVYEGNDIFDSIHNSTTINVPTKTISSNIKITGIDGNLTVHGTLKDSTDKAIANVTVNYQIGEGEVQNTTTKADGSFAFIGVNGATITVSYIGNENFTGSSDSITLSDITSNNEENKTISELQTQLDEAKTNATKLNNNLTEANKKADNLTAQLSEAQKQLQNTSSTLISTTISANNLNIQALTSGNLQVTLKDANNNLLVNKSVQVIINGVTYKGTTNSKGVASISVKYANAGTYNAVVSFIGDDTYKGSIATSKVTVNKKATTLTAKKATLKVKKAKKIKITLKSNGKSVAGKTITIKVNKKTFKAKTNKNGVATIKVKVAKKGKFTAVVKFAGDSTYKAITKKIKLTVKK